MAKCEICGREFTVINYLHLRTHGITFDEYKAKYPDADIGDTSDSTKKFQGVAVIKKKRKWEHGNGHVKYSRILIRDGDKDTQLPFEQSVVLQYKQIKEKYKWTNTVTLERLITLWKAHEETEAVQSIVHGIVTSNSCATIPDVGQHREKLHKLLVILEDRAFAEKDTIKLANLTEKITKINEALPRLEKSYDSSVDEKINKLVERRKLICKNYLPDLKIESVPI